MSTDSNLMIKCIFIGNLSVGKTSIILRYTKNEFASGYIPTIGADFTTSPLKINEELENIDLKTKNKNILDELSISYDEFKQFNSKYSEENKIYIWDLAGQPLFKRIRTYYMSHAQIAVIVVDLSKTTTFDINPWYKDFKIYSPDSDFILVGNKKDIVDFEDDELKKKIKSLENKFKCKMHLISAKTGEGITDLFIEIKLRLQKRFS